MKQMEMSLPFVSALLVTRNEQEYIERAMLSLINQTYPKTKYEIIVIDGESTDNTLKIINSLIKQYKNPSFDIRVVNNPKHILSTGWNIGIKNAKGDYVVRIDAHAEAADDFLEKSVETIMRIENAVCVGGRLSTKSINEDDNIIAKVLSSPFGVGNSTFRVSDSPGYTDTAVFGLYRKSIFEQVGYFNEQYVRNQDIELHSRIRKMGGKFYFNPQINCTYYSRNTTKKMIKQAYGNGKWNMVLLRNQSTALRFRHLIPFVFASFLILTSILGFIHKWFWFLELGVLLLYLLFGIFFATKKTNNIIEICKMTFLFLLLHLSYGLGYLSGILIKIDNGKEEF